MGNFKEQLSKFCANKDEYVFKNSKFVMEYLTQYEQHNLKSYNSGGYAYQISRMTLTQGARPSMKKINEVIDRT